MSINSQLECKTSPGRCDFYVAGELVCSIRYSKSIGWIMYDAQGKALRQGDLWKLVQRVMKEGFDDAAEQAAELEARRRDKSRAQIPQETHYKRQGAHYAIAHWLLNRLDFPFLGWRARW